MSVGESRLGSYRKIFRRSESLVARWPHLGDALGFGAFVIAYYFSYVYGMSFGKAAASPFWFPDSILLCALLKSRYEKWWLLVLATLPIRLFSEVAYDVPMWFLLATFAIDTAKGLVAALALRHFIRNPIRFETVQELAIYGLVAVLLVPVASAFGGAAARAALGDDYWLAWLQWFMGDALTQLVVTPTILYWVLGISWNAMTLDVKRLLEAGLLSVGLILTGYLASHTGADSTAFTESRFYAPVPFLFWAAIRFGMLGTTGAVAVIALLAIEAALEGHGPFSGRSPDETAFVLQNFLLLRSAPLLLVAVLIDQGKRDQKWIDESRRRLEHAQRLATMGQLTAAIAHELRQPLSAIMSNAEAAATLLNSANPPMQQLREIISDIRADDRHASEVIKRIRDFTGKREARLELLDLSSIIADALHLVAGDARSRGVQVRTDLTPGTQLVFGNRTQLEQVLINLAINGMDAMANTPQSTRCLTVQARPHGSDQVEVAVMDCGGGIASEDLPRLFESFFTTKAEGMGLGLFVVKSIVESHRGRIWVENNPHGGAIFHFSLPIAQNPTTAGSETLGPKLG